MSKLRRTGLRRDPPGGWPLDRLFVGVATLRTIRELFRQAPPSGSTLRAWDLSLWSGVTAQGSSEALERLRGPGLVKVYEPDGPGHALQFRLAGDYPLLRPLAALFEAERACVRGELWRAALSDRKRPIDGG
ncbi:MAG TPA: hypothetical protein VEY33_11170 [Gemmatimonadota bacterium]|nr:hypothetical protein [Gemmatimonadota bacterium]